MPETYRYKYENDIFEKRNKSRSKSRERDNFVSNSNEFSESFNGGLSSVIKR